MNDITDDQKLVDGSSDLSAILSYVFHQRKCG